MQHWTRRGFTTVERFSIVALDLLASASTIYAPKIDGIEIVSLAERPDLVRVAWQVEVDAWSDMPGQDRVPPPFEMWEASVQEGRRPMAGCFVAVDDKGEAVGITTTSVSASDAEQAHNAFTGVARAARGRGIALALKLRQVEWCRAAGYHVLETTNHEDNAAMRAINEKLGYRPRPAQLVMHGPPATGVS